MRQKPYSILFLPILALMPLSLWAETLSVSDLETAIPGLTDPEAHTLAESGQVTRFLDANSRPRLIPRSSLAPSVERAYTTVENAIGAEALFVMEPGEGSRKECMLRWYNVLRSISTMKGIEYNSVTHGHPRVLFRSSYVIDNPVDQRPMPDALVSSIPAYSTLTILQEDTTLGKAIFHLHYRGAQDAISMSMVNLNHLDIGFVPVIGKKHMILQLMLLPYKGYLLFYGGVEVRMFAPFGLQNAARDSFVNRIEALRTWFQNVKARG